MDHFIQVPGRRRTPSGKPQPPKLYRGRGPRDRAELEVGTRSPYGGGANGNRKVSVLVKRTLALRLGWDKGDRVTLLLGTGKNLGKASLVSAGNGNGVGQGWYAANRAETYLCVTPTVKAKVAPGKIADHMSPTPVEFRILAGDVLEFDLPAGFYETPKPLIAHQAVIPTLFDEEIAQATRPEPTVANSLDDRALERLAELVAQRLLRNFIPGK